MKATLVLTALIAASFATNSFAQSRKGTSLRAAAYIHSLVDLANKKYNSAENMHSVARVYKNSFGKGLSSSRQVKSALARCVFMDGAYSQLDDAYRAAHVVWVKLRDSIRAGRLRLHIDRGYKANPYRNLKTLSDTCNVAGAPCGLVFETPGYASLYVRGDNCQ